MELINKQLLNEAIKIYTEFRKVNQIKFELNDAKISNNIELIEKYEENLNDFNRSYNDFLIQRTDNSYYKLINLWNNSLKIQLEFWDKETFETLFENALKILINNVSKGEDSIKETYNKLLVLQDVYIKRFGQIEYNFDTQNDLKICFLVELGVIEHLISKNLSQNKIAEIIQFLTKTPISKGSVNTTLSRITHENLIDKYKTQLSELKIKYKI